ncbi:MAG: SusF/SusE family outer membrane protein [Tenuifilaceae bacterium]|jgi:hypothetical protein|nr:SusF/SusE family outer membrane protein [Tenuifilaceae bacterium]
MKVKSIHRILGLLLTASVFMIACTEESSDVRLDPKLSTSQVQNITSESATITGFVIAQGDGFTERGVCYNTLPEPTTDNDKVIFDEELAEGATFDVELTALDYATDYYARAYAIGYNGVIYGEEITFTTLPIAPELTTKEATEITGNSAKSGGNVTNNGGAEVTVRGICFATHDTPTIDDSKTENGEGVGEFTSDLSDLKGNTEYFVRAYATNSAGTGYGPAVSFTTLVDLPNVSTAAVESVTKTSAISGGNVTDDGGANIIERGIVFGISENPTTEDQKVIDATNGTGEFVSNMTGLELATTYHVRAYAINSAGTAYGDNISFKTLADITKFFVVGDYNGWNNSETAKYIISTETSEGMAEGYIYLTSGGIKLTTDHSWDSASTFGDDGAGNLTNPGDNITVPADGHYWIKASLNDMSYSLTLMNWGIIGDATPGGWGAQTALTYNETLDKWIGGYSLLAGEFKFRANDDWDLNYGSTAGDNTLDAGGSNIAITENNDYAITLDLSVPNEYTYSANRWGLIGDATPGGWSDDTDMTWDSANGVFTVTVDLTANLFKFRANDDWAVNLGGSLGSLTPGGGDIAVAEDGNYTITLDPWNNIATMVKN